MTMQTIFAVRGVSNVGKTTAIQITFDELVNKHQATIEFHEPLGARDFRAAVLVSGMRVGIISQGDNPRLLRSHLHRVLEQNTDVIVCATRSKGGTVDAINGLSPPFKIEWIRKRSDVPGGQADSNRQCGTMLAETIVALAQNNK